MHLNVSSKWVGDADRRLSVQPLDPVSTVAGSRGSKPTLLIQRSGAGQRQALCLQAHPEVGRDRDGPIPIIASVQSLCRENFAKQALDCTSRSNYPLISR